MTYRFKNLPQAGQQTEHETRSTFGRRSALSAAPRTSSSASWPARAFCAVMIGATAVMLVTGVI